VHALGTHLLVELKECNAKTLNDLKRVEEILISAAKEAKATIVETFFHKFSPFGISGVVVIAESHLSIHTWPEYNYAAVDIFTCGESLQPGVAATYLISKLQSKSPSVMEVKRGMLSANGAKLPHKASKGEMLEHDRAKELQMVL
jgi:S-adenosylmethionine decarboxylase